MEPRSRPTSAAIIFRARQLTRLSQAELADRVGVDQPTISAYERGARTPRVTTLERLVDAAGLRLTWDLAHGGSGGGPRAAMAGPIGRQVVEHREAVIDALARYRFSNPRVVGDVAEGRERHDSLLLLVVDDDSQLPGNISRNLAAAGASGARIDAPIKVMTEADYLARGYPPEDLEAALPLADS